MAPVGEAGIYAAIGGSQNDLFGLVIANQSIKSFQSYELVRKSVGTCKIGRNSTDPTFNLAPAY